MQDTSQPPPHKDIIIPSPPKQVRYTTLPNGKRTIVFQRKYDKLILLLHIHKSAGSFLCKRAFDNRLAAPYASNCNIQENQYCCGSNDTQIGLQDFVNATPFDLIATERELQETMDTSLVDYVVSLRDSKSRYYSHYQHVLRHWYSSSSPEGGVTITKPVVGVVVGVGVVVNETSAWLGNNTNNNDDPNNNSSRIAIAEFDPIHHADTDNFTRWTQGQPDNWNLRIICGPRCKSRPKFQITHELFQYTLQRLASFQHVIFVEDMQESYNQMALTYQWKVIDENDKNAKPTKRGNYNKTDVTMARWNPLMSALDDALYEFAKLKYYSGGSSELPYEFVNQAQVDEYFALGPLQNCTNVCCGQCTPY
ncbi:unnamed protein product [Cylindrotheca closterium]|uniref:Uncharacterized protein n=1 Tax=Cylindrotheca closterium TaxID=2856 RepID=A0AAD2PVB0_9STRA|nr:unnamed protein product [Cylindrotheca closterium]